MKLPTLTSKNILSEMATILATRAGSVGLTTLSNELVTLSNDISITPDTDFYYSYSTPEGEIYEDAWGVLTRMFGNIESVISNIKNETILTEIKDEVVTIDDHLDIIQSEVVTIDDHLDRIQSTIIDVDSNSNVAGPTFRSMENYVMSDSSWDTLMKAIVIHSLKKSDTLDEVEAEVPNVPNYTS